MNLKNPIQRGNGVSNDNLAALGDLLIENQKKLEEVQAEVNGVRNTINDIDKKNTPREVKTFWLLVLTVILSLIAILVTIAYSN